MRDQIAVIGAGSWGSALANLLANKGNPVVLWARELEIVEGIRLHRRNPIYLPDLELSSNITPTSDLRVAVESSSYIISVVPSHAMRMVWSGLGRGLSRDSIVVCCTKGIEVGSLKLMSELLSDELPDHPEGNRVVLSGPSFAHEVALNKPTSVVIAGPDPAICVRVQDLFRTESFLTFTHSDIIGVEVGGAVKNVLAIACGIADGLGLGLNARAAIITRGLYEMIKIGRAMGGNPLTFSGLSGIGDLVLTCTGALSRNHSTGVAVARGKGIDQLGLGVQIAEGIETSRAIHRLIEREGIKAPICDAVYRILFERLSPDDAVRELCRLDLGYELGSII